MVVLSAAISAVFLSPLLFILAIAAGFLLMARGRRRTGIAVTAVSGLVLYLASIEPVHDALLFPLEDRYPALSMENPPFFDAIVVLGGGTIASSPDLGGKASLTATALKRLVYGIVLYRERRVPVFVSGGKVWERSPEPEAEAAQRTLVALDVPQATVRTEGKSRTTWENARELAPMLRSSGVGVVALVTSAYHMPRSALAFSKAGIRFVPAPTDYHTARVPYNLLSFLPSYATLSDTFLVLREYLGLVQYSVRR